LGDTLVVTLGLLDTEREACLSGMSVPEWERFSAKLSALPVSDVSGQAIRRRLYSMAAACEVDKQGRILIPAQLRVWRDSPRTQRLSALASGLRYGSPKR
jgi:MraZ protein